jgi:hypothetical protein
MMLDVMEGAVGLRANDKLARKAVFKVAFWFHMEGFGVYVPPPRFAPRLSECFDYVDNGDLFLTREFWPKQRIEVKRRPDLHFTDAESYRFPTVWFTNDAALQRAGSSVDAYYCANAEVTHAAIVAQHTRRHWRKTGAFMANSGHWEDVWEIDKRLVSYVSIEVA